MDDLGAYAGELALQAYGPLIDKIGRWCLGLIVTVFIGKFTLWWWKQL